MTAVEQTILTDRQVEVLELREQGYTQKEVASRLGTTDSNVSAIERAAEENVQKARGTLKLVRTLRSPVRFTVPAGAKFDELVGEVYSEGDETGIKISYCRPELYSHLYHELETHTSQNRLDTAVTLGLTEDGEVKVFTGEL